MTDDAQASAEPAPTPSEIPVPEAPEVVAEPTPEVEAGTAIEETPKPVDETATVDTVPSEISPLPEFSTIEPIPEPTQSVEQDIPAETPTPELPRTQSQPSASVITNPIPGADGRNKSAATRARKREEHLDKILAHARTTEWITNDDIEKLLHVSGATATRYLNMLVLRGKLWREGKTRSIRYRIVA